MKKKKAILAGASGAIGSYLLQQLLADAAYTEVLIILRKAMDLQHPKLKQLVLNFDHINDYSTQIKGDIVFCCLGTTKKQTPDKALYRKIDFQYPLDLAWIAQTNGAESYHFVSAIGASKNSSIFYSKTKGEAEQELKAVPFKSLYIYRPSLLNGKRSKKRLMEGILNALMYIVNPLLIGSLKKYRSIKIEAVATAMHKRSLEDKRGVFIYESDKIQKYSSENNLT